MKINTKLSFKELVKQKGYTPYFNNEVVAIIPKPFPTSEIELFTLEKYITENELEKEYESRGLAPANPFHLISLEKNLLDEKKYVATHWKDDSGKWCFATFDRWGDGERRVGVNRLGNGWDDHWWFAGVRKLALKNSTT